MVSKGCWTGEYPQMQQAAPLTKFNIIVPTRNRAGTLVHSLRTILRQDYPNFRVIVSDNFSTDDTRTAVESFHEPRITYVNTGRPLSMKENWDFALQHVQDGWVGFVGDDDGLVPGALRRVAEVIAETGLQAVTSSWCRYTWPSKGLRHASQLILPLGRGFEIRNSSHWLERVLSGIWRYGELPYIYTGGFVDIEVVRQATTEHGEFFRAVNPDIYSAIAISSLIEKFAFIHEPIALRGTSIYSTGASSLGGSDNPQPLVDIRNDVKKFFHEQLQDIELPSSIPLGVLDSYLQSAFLRPQETLASRAQAGFAATVAMAKPEEKAFFIDYCARVAKRNLWPFDYCKPTTKLRVFYIRAAYFLIEAKRVIASAIFNLEAMGVQDVYDASIAAKTLYLNHPGKISLLFNRIHFTLQELFPPTSSS